jgi:5-methylcytosine-specific restriction endonuclease McrA
MLAKGNGNLVNGPQSIPQTNTGTSTACSVMNPLDADRLENLQVLCTDCHRAKTKTDLKVLSRVR